MFSIDEGFLRYPPYFRQNDLYVRALGVILGVFFILQFVRSQVNEVEVLQLVPGLYLLLIFFCWLLLAGSTIFFERVSKQVDFRKVVGTKTIYRMNIAILAKSDFLISSNQVFLALCTIIPVGLYQFESYGERNLENLWSLTEIITLELYLLFVVIFFSQLPIVTFLTYKGEKYSLNLPTIWRLIGLICCILGGVVTPTIDSSTQLCFAGCCYYLYVLLIGGFKKRADIKYKEVISLS